MSPEPSLASEPSIADVISRVLADVGLSDAKKTAWATGLRSISRALDRTPDQIVARWAVLSPKLRKIHAAEVGLTAGSYANARSSAKAALLWASEAGYAPARGVPLDPRWNELRQAIVGNLRREILSGFIRWASARGLTPDAADDAALENYLAYRREVLGQNASAIFQRNVARSWNACVGTVPGWPQHRLTERPHARQTAIDWAEFPATLDAEIEAWFVSQQQVRRRPGRARARPCKPSTIITRRRELHAIARRAVATGTPIDEVNSLAALLDPEVIERVFDGMCKNDDPSRFMVEMGWRLHAIARDTGALDVEKLDRLRDIRDALEEQRPPDMTEKNLKLIRRVMSPGVWDGVIALPEKLMTDALKKKTHSPVRAAQLAQAAIGVALLTFAPVRIGNLASTRIGQHLVRSAGGNSAYSLIFKGKEVKNGVHLEFALDLELTHLIDVYIREFRPFLVSGDRDCLFPGRDGARTPTGFSARICRTIEKELGFSITAHQFRHAAAAVVLQHDPGNYVYVSKILGHTSTESTRAFYVALEGAAATLHFGKILRKNVSAARVAT